MAVDFEAQMMALEIRQLDLMRRENDMIDERRELVEDYARLAKLAIENNPALKGTLELIVDSMRQGVASMRKHEIG